MRVTNIDPISICSEALLNVDKVVTVGAKDHFPEVFLINTSAGELGELVVSEEDAHLVLREMGYGEQCDAGQ